MTVKEHHYHGIANVQDKLFTFNCKFCGLLFDKKLKILLPNTYFLLNFLHKLDLYMR